MAGDVCNKPGLTADQCAAEAAWASVRIAADTADLATATFWANLAGMVFVALAALFAFKAYREASKANRISLDSAERQDRAYVDFDGVSYECKPQTHGAPVPTRLRIELKNFGQTPADDLTLSLDYGLFESKDQNKLKGATEELKGLGAIMPQDQWGRTTSFNISDGEFLALQTGSVELRVSIGATYTDAFGKLHTLASTFVGSGAKATLGFVPGTRTNS